MKFKNAIDIMLFKSPEVEVTLAQVEKEKAPKTEMLSMALPSDSQAPLQKTFRRSSALDFLKSIFGLSAAEAYESTQLQMERNAQRLIREEATEMLEKALKAIQEAITDEKFCAELGGAGRPTNNQFVLKKALSEYRADSRQHVCEHLKEMGYQVREVEGVYLSMDWSQGQRKIGN